MDILQTRHSIGHLLNASRLAPWRAQRQWIGALLLAALGLAMVASLYLDVTSQAAIAGREIQDISSQVIAVEQANADLQSRLAEITSADAMEQRAAALGYAPADSGDADVRSGPRLPSSGAGDPGGIADTQAECGKHAAGVFRITDLVAGSSTQRAREPARPEAPSEGGLYLAISDHRRPSGVHCAVGHPPNRPDPNGPGGGRLSRPG